MITFTIPGEPVPQLRPRISRTRKGTRLRDPDKTRVYKKHVKWVANQYAPQELIESALGVNLKIYRPMLKKLSKNAQEEAEAGNIRPVTKPDADNYCKPILDALNGLIYRDDSQIVDVQTEKYYSYEPRAEVTIIEVF